MNPINCSPGNMPFSGPRDIWIEWQPLTKYGIAERTPSKYQAEGGSFNNAIGRLRTLELIKGRREMVLSEELV